MLLAKLAILIKLCNSLKHSGSQALMPICWQTSLSG